MKAYDMSKHWRLINVEASPDDDVKVSGTFWVSQGLRNDEVQVKAIDVQVWYERRQYGRVIREMFARVDADDVVKVPAHMIDDRVRDDVLDNIEAIKAAVLAVARVEWRPLAASEVPA
jgi:peroxiredoxin family protein